MLETFPRECVRLCTSTGRYVMDAKVPTPAAPLSVSGGVAAATAAASGLAPIDAESEHEEEDESERAVPSFAAAGGGKKAASLSSSSSSSFSFGAKPAATGSSWGSWGSTTSSGFKNVGYPTGGWGGGQSSFGKPSSGFGGFSQPSSGFGGGFGQPSSGFSFGTLPNSGGDLAVKQQLQQQREQKAKEEQEGSAAAAAVPAELAALGDNLGSFGDAKKAERRRRTCHELVFVPMLLRNSALQGDVELRDVVDGTGTVKVHASRAISTHIAGLKLPRADMIVPRRVRSLFLRCVCEGGDGLSCGLWRMKRWGWGWGCGVEQEWVGG